MRRARRRARRTGEEGSPWRRTSVRAQSQPPEHSASTDQTTAELGAKGARASFGSVWMSWMSSAPLATAPSSESVVACLSGRTRIGTGWVVIVT